MVCTTCSPLSHSRLRGCPLRTAVAVFTAIAGAMLVSPVALAVQDELSSFQLQGREIFADQCAHCHGDAGQGVPEEYSDALTGDLPIAELASVIEKTMPEEDPSACVGDDARAVAEYIYQSFYSEAAQQRLNPAKAELSRLTVRQYRESVAEIIAVQTGTAKVEERGALKGSYYNSRSPRSDKRILERLDRTVDFDYGTQSPLPGKISEEEFAIQWEGGVFADSSGDYEFIVATDNSMRLWINDSRIPLIDAKVASGTDVDHSATIRLLGGRYYFLRLELAKTKRQKGESVASVSLQWKLPSGVRQVIPDRHFATGRFPKVMTVETNFPPDDRSYGYERGISISKDWDSATTQAAIEIANKVVERLPELAGFREDTDSEKRNEKCREFLVTFVSSAFRKPLDSDQQENYIHRYFAGLGDSLQETELAVKKVVLLTLKSPRFLYPNIDRSASDGASKAGRLALTLWDSPPDKSLQDRVGKGYLETEEQLRSAAREMVESDRCRAKMRDFARYWLHIDQQHDLTKDSQLYPDFSSDIIYDYEVSLGELWNSIVWSESSDFRQLFLSERMYASPRMVEALGWEAPPMTGFQWLTVDNENRGGVLTHPYLMAAFAHSKSSSPIHRGVFAVRSFVGRVLKAPAMAIALLDEGQHPDLTTRERIEMQTRPEGCQICHNMINPLGFTLESFDAIGRYREMDAGKQVDPSGGYRDRFGEAVQFRDSREMAEFLASSREVHQSFVEQLFEYLTKQPVQAYGLEARDQLVERFRESEFNIKALLVEIAIIASHPPKSTEQQLVQSLP